MIQSRGSKLLLHCCTLQCKNEPELLRNALWSSKDYWLLQVLTLEFGLFNILCVRKWLVWRVSSTPAAIKAQLWKEKALAVWSELKAIPVNAQNSTQPHLGSFPWNVNLKKKSSAMRREALKVHLIIKCHSWMAIFMRLFCQENISIKF